MRIYKYDIVFQEVPDHISLAFYVCGCPVHCPGCHSPELWTETTGYPLSAELFDSLIQKYHRQISCVLFMGGEWHPFELIDFLSTAQNRGLKTALYTGLDSVISEIENHLDYLKTGPWKWQLGGLASATTNQKFKDVRNNVLLNHLFRSPNTEEQHDQNESRTDQ